LQKPIAIAAPTRLSWGEVKSACGIAARLAPVRVGVYGEAAAWIVPRASHGVVRGDIEREGAMSWTKPAFEEIKMDAEAKSYSDGITW